MELVLYRSRQKWYLRPFWKTEFKRSRYGIWLSKILLTVVQYCLPCDHIWTSEKMSKNKPTQETVPNYHFLLFSIKIHNCKAFQLPRSASPIPTKFSAAFWFASCSLFVSLCWCANFKIGKRFSLEVLLYPAIIIGLKENRDRTLRD